MFILSNLGYIYSLLSSDTIWWHQVWASIDSGNGLLPDSSKQFPKPMLTLSSKVFCGIQLRAISQVLLMYSGDYSFRFTKHLPWENQLRVLFTAPHCLSHIPLLVEATMGSFSRIQSSSSSISRYNSWRRMASCSFLRRCTIGAWTIMEKNVKSAT